MLKVTTRYLASNFIPPFTIGFLFFVAFLNTFYMFRIISLIVNKGVDINTILNIVASLSVSFFPMATPLAVFFATIYTLNKFSEDSEIIALRSFGYTKFQIYRPFLACSLIIAATMFSLNSIYIPKANANFRYTIKRLTSSGMLASIKEGQFFTDIPNITLFADKVNEEGDKFDKIFLHLKSSEDTRIIMANKGELKKIKASENASPDLRLYLEDGNIVRVDPKGNEIEKIVFKEYDFPVMQSSGSLGSIEKDSIKTNAELVEVIKEKKVKFEEFLTQKDKIENFSAQLKRQTRSLVKSQIELQTRYMTFFQIVFFVLLAFSLGVKKGRGATGNNTAKAIIILLGYYALYFFLISMAQKGAIPPLLATILPVGVLFCFSIYYYRKLDWAS